MPNYSILPAIKEYNPDDDTDLSSGVAAWTISVEDPESTKLGHPKLRRFSFQPIFANYTSVTVKAQGTLDGTTWADIASATTSTSGDIVDVDCSETQGPFSQVRVLVTGTLSASTDTFDLWVMKQYTD